MVDTRAFKTESCKRFEGSPSICFWRMSEKTEKADAIAVGGNHLRKPGWLVFGPSKQEVNTIWFKIVKGLKHLHLSEIWRISEKKLGVYRVSQKKVYYRISGHYGYQAANQPLPPLLLCCAVLSSPLCAFSSFKANHYILILTIIPCNLDCSS